MTFSVARTYFRPEFNWGWGKIIAFYNVNLAVVPSEVFEFYIREDDAGRIIIDSDDTLQDYLCSLNMDRRKINELVGKISQRIHEDYFG